MLPLGHDSAARTSGFGQTREQEHPAICCLSQGHPDSCRPIEAVCFPPKDALRMVHAAQRRPIAAFSVGLFYMSSNFGVRTIAYGSCYTDVPALSGKAVWINPIR